MPMYQRRCVQCRHSAEHFAHASQCDEIRCPECGAATETDPAQYESQHAHGDELTGTRSRLYDVTIHPDEADEVRQKFAGTGCNVVVERDGVGRVYAPTKTAMKAWTKRERELKGLSGAKTG
ncbi:MAG: zinc ribbon domain-containing protein [Planctomycetes bacterium]|nr:zinc ribbon domain-containing protein [Planctomycetota bacterium]